MKKLYALLIFFLFSCVENHNFRLQEVEVKKVELSFPTGIFFSTVDTAFYITTANGTLAMCDTNLRVRRSKQFNGYSFSQIFVDDFFIYVISSQGLLKIDKNTMEIISKIQFSNLGLKFNDIKGLYFNPIDKTFDIVSQSRKYPTIVQYNPINFRKIKLRKLKELKKINCATYAFKYLYILDNKSMSVSMLEITKNYEEIQKFKFSAPQISSLTNVNPNIFVLLSTETRRAFFLKAKQNE